MLAGLSAIRALDIGELVGIVVMLWGFLVSEDLVRMTKPVPTQTPA
jgi:hypothetical protein